MKFRYFIDVIVTLSMKDFKIRYRNSMLGFIWSLLNPLAYMVILWFVFSRLLTPSIPNFAAWILIGILIWRFFAQGTTQGLYSLLSNPSLVGKIYLPRFMIVLSNNVANLLGASLEFAALIPVLILLGISLNAYMLFLPILLAAECLLVFALSLSLSSLTLRYRDFHQLWDIALQLGFFLSPIVYDVHMVPVRYRSLYELNPVTLLIDQTRTIFLSGGLPSAFSSVVLFATILVLLGSGYLIFTRLEGTFADKL